MTVPSTDALDAEVVRRSGRRDVDYLTRAEANELRELLTVSGEDEALKHLSPTEKRQKTFEAMRVLTMAGRRGART